MVARIALMSDTRSNTDPTTIGVSGIQLGWKSVNVETSEAVGHSSTIYQGQADD